MNGRCKSVIGRLVQELENQEAREKSALYGRLIFVVCFKTAELVYFSIFEFFSEL